MARLSFMFRVPNDNHTCKIEEVAYREVIFVSWRPGVNAVRHNHVMDSTQIYMEDE